MEKNGDSGCPGWGASSFVQTAEDAPRAFFAASSAATVQSTRPSVVYSSRDDSQLQKLKRQVTKMLKGFSPPPEVKGAYNPEDLTSQKRQWARFQLKLLDQRSVKEPSRVFESMVVVGLHPSVDVRALGKQVADKNIGDLKRSRSLLNHHHQVHAEPNLEPQILFVYPPEKRLPLRYKDLLSFCFPGGVEVHAVERTPSLSELNGILLGQEQIQQSNQSFIFRLQVADDSTLYGCCVFVEEIVQKPSKLVSMIMGEQPLSSSLSRHLFTTSRCYCILSRLPFFDLHFGILRSIFTEERFERVEKGIEMLNVLSPEGSNEKDSSKGETASTIQEQYYAEDARSTLRSSDSDPKVSPYEKTSDNGNSADNQISEMNLDSEEIVQNNAIVEVEQETRDPITEKQAAVSIRDGYDDSVNEVMQNSQSEGGLPADVLPLLRCRQCENSVSSSRFQSSPSEDRSAQVDTDEVEPKDPTSSDREDFDAQRDILEWAKANNHGSLQIVCEYYRLKCPARGSTLTFQPLEYLHPLEYHRPGETVLSTSGSTIDLRSRSTSLGVVEAHSALLAEEEAAALSVFAIACLCGSLRLEHVMMMFAGALLEKQIAIVCSNLGILSASVLSVIPLIRPYQWQSLLMPVLPNDMLDFLDAPVPYVVGIKNRSADIQSKLANVIIIDVNRNQVKSPSMPQLPQQKELLSSLRPYHATLVGESLLAKKRPVYECTDVQVEAAKGFLAVLRSYLDSLCSNLRSHTITNVQSNNDKVSLLLKESFIDSYPYRDRPFMKLFVDTQLFSVQTDLVLSFYQKD